MGLMLMSHNPLSQHETIAWAQYSWGERSQPWNASPLYCNLGLTKSPAQWVLQVKGKYKEEKCFGFSKPLGLALWITTHQSSDGIKKIGIATRQVKVAKKGKGTCIATI